MCLSAFGAAAAGTSWPSLPLASASRPCSSAWGEAIRPPPPDPRDLRPPRQVSLSSRFGSLQPALPQRVCPRLPPSSDPARAPPPPVHHDGPYCSRATASVPLSRPAWSRPARQPGPLASAPRRKSPLLLPGRARSTRAFWNAYRPTAPVFSSRVIAVQPSRGRRHRRLRHDLLTAPGYVNAFTANPFLQRGRSPPPPGSGRSPATLGYTCVCPGRLSSWRPWGTSRR
jgi:hypothetical protein